MSHIEGFATPCIIGGFRDYHDLLDFVATANRLLFFEDLLVRELPFDETRPLYGYRGVLYAKEDEPALAAYLETHGFPEGVS